MEAVQIETPTLTQTVRIEIGENETSREAVLRLCHALDVGTLVRIRGEAFRVQRVRPFPIVSPIEEDPPSGSRPKIDWFGEGPQEPSQEPLKEEVPEAQAEPESSPEPVVEASEADTLRPPEPEAEAPQEGSRTELIGVLLVPRDKRRKQDPVRIVGLEAGKLLLEDGRRVDCKRLSRYTQLPQ
jgi:hypothetical protein